GVLTNTGYLQSYRAFLYSNSQMVDLNALLPSGSMMSMATGVNNLGQVVGTYFDANLFQHGFLYSGGSLTTFANAFPQAINDSTQITGYLSTASGDHAFLYSGGQFTDLGVLGTGFLNSYGYGINASGQVVGQSDAGSGSQVNGQPAFVYGSGQMTVLGT